MTDAVSESPASQSDNNGEELDAGTISLRYLNNGSLVVMTTRIQRNGIQDLTSHFHISFAILGNPN